MTVPRAHEKPSRVLLVDQHPILRRGLQALLESERDLVVCGEAAEHATAIRLIEALSPELVILDISLQRGHGLELIRDMRVRHSEVAALVFSIRDERLYAKRALRAGARGYVMKREPGAQILAAVRRVMAGHVAVSEAVSSGLLEHVNDGGATTSDDVFEQLTDREIEVLELIGRGLGTREISRQLHLSPKTVESHRQHLKEKLDITSTALLIPFAVRWAEGIADN